MRVSAHRVSSNPGYTGGLWSFSMSIIQLIIQFFYAKTVNRLAHHLTIYFYIPAALKWLQALYVRTTSALSMGSSCQILYSCIIFMLRTVIFMDHMQDTANKTTSSPQKSLQSNKQRYCLKDKGGFQPLVGSSLSSLTPYNDIKASNLLTYISCQWLTM